MLGARCLIHYPPPSLVLNGACLVQSTSSPFVAKKPPPLIGRARDINVSLAHPVRPCDLASTKIVHAPESCAHPKLPFFPRPNRRACTTGPDVARRFRHRNHCTSGGHQPRDAAYVRVQAARIPPSCSGGQRAGRPDFGAHHRDTADGQLRVRGRNSRRDFGGSLPARPMPVRPAVTV